MDNFAASISASMPPEIHASEDSLASFTDCDSADVKWLPTRFQESADNLRKALETALFSDEVDLRTLFRLAREHPSETIRELTDMLEKQRAERRLAPILGTFGVLAQFNLVQETPDLIVKLARSADGSVSYWALEAAARIHDQKANDLFIDILRSPPASDENRELFDRAVKLARCTGSPRLAPELNRLAQEGSVMAIRSLAHIGFGADPVILAAQAEMGRRPEVRIAARTALEAVNILTPRYPQVRLIETLKRPPAIDQWFSWPEWALDKIERLRLTECIEDLRRLYEEFRKCPHPLPDHEHYRRYWNAFRLKMLRTIQRLGGPLTSEEVDALKVNPVLIEHSP